MKVKLKSTPAKIKIHKTGKGQSHLRPKPFTSLPSNESECERSWFSFRLY